LIEMRNNIILLLLLVATIASAQKRKDFRDNKIKGYTETKVDYSTGKEIKEIKNVSLFDVNGNLVEYVEYDNKKVIIHEKYEYDTGNNKIKETHIDATGKIFKTIEIKYDQAERKIKETHLDASGKTTKIEEFKYNQAGFKTEEINYYPNGKIKSKNVYNYEYFQ